MKTKLSVILGGLLLLGQVAWGATSTTFTVSASVPEATGVTITVSQVTSANNVFNVIGGTALSFDPMTFTPGTPSAPLNIYLPDHYFALDFGAANGAGTPDVTLTYTEGANPNSGSATNAHGLGYKATATFVQELPQQTGPTQENVTALGKMRLIDLKGTHEPYTVIQPGWLRVYVGIWTGNTSTIGHVPDPATGEPFTNGDTPGKYTGSLLVTAVVN